MSSRTYTQADADTWAEQLRKSNGQAQRADRLLLAWRTLKDARPAMLTMVVTDGLAVDGGDARSAAISVRLPRGKE